MNETLIDRYRFLDSRRTSKVQRCRDLSSLTLPSLLPPEYWSEEDPLNMPYSSASGRGVTALASRMLSALMPLNDLPFFKFGIKTGEEPKVEVENYLNNLSYQVYEKLMSKNLRPKIFQALQHLIVCGDCLLIMEDDFTFRVLRIDQYVVRRGVQDQVIEIILLEYERPEDDSLQDEAYADSVQSLNTTDLYSQKGYKTKLCQYKLQEDGSWNFRKEDPDGEVLQEGTYSVLPFIPLRWVGVTGEDYGRSHCEEIYGDIQTLEGFTEALVEGMAAGSTFYMGVDPAGITEIDDLAGAGNGQWVSARQQDVFTLSPAGTMNPQIQQTTAAVERMRREIGTAFLMTGSSIPSGDRVTATAVRMIGQELEQVLGGAFSAIAREMMSPIVQRAVFLMLNEESIDPRLAEQFTEDGVLTVDIVTGLQALSRETELTKLMQLGDMMRNLPPEVITTFKYDSYARALVSSLGFNPDNWIKNQEELAEEQAKQMEQQAQMQMAQAAATGVSQGIGAVGREAAPQLAAQALGQEAPAMEGAPDA